MWRDGKISLRDVALRKGKYEAYRELQATILAHYFDLTHGLDEVARIKKALREQPLEVNPGTPKALESIERLVVPRTKHYAAAAPETRKTQELDQPIRSLRRHKVTWHRRELPEGWRASPAALELAESLGVTLKENETLVKQHHRGTKALGEITAHQFVTTEDA